MWENSTKMTRELVTPTVFVDCSTTWYSTLTITARIPTSIVHKVPLEHFLN